MKAACKQVTSDIITIPIKADNVASLNGLLVVLVEGSRNPLHTDLAVKSRSWGGGGGGGLASVKLLTHWCGDCLSVWDSKTKGINHIQKAKHTVLASDEVYKMKMALQKKNRKKSNLTHYAQSTSTIISGQREEKEKWGRNSKEKKRPWRTRELEKKQTESWELSKLNRKKAEDDSEQAWCYDVRLLQVCFGLRVIKCSKTNENHVKHHALYDCHEFNLGFQE